MAIIDDLDKLTELCRVGAKKSLDALLALGPKPDAPVEALLWEQQTTRLQGQINSLSALVAKLTALAVIQGLQQFDDELATIGAASKAAVAKIKQIEEVSDLLTKLAKVLDLGLAVLAAAAAPSPVTLAAVIKAGTAVASEI